MLLNMSSDIKVNEGDWAKLSCDISKDMVNVDSSKKVPKVLFGGPQKCPPPRVIEL